MTEIHDLKPLDVARDLLAMRSLPGLPTGLKQQMELAADSISALYAIAVAACCDNLALRGVELEERETLQ